MESPEIISPFRRLAKAIPQWLLPVAVGPKMTATLGFMPLPPSDTIFYTAITAAQNFRTP